MSSKKFLTLLLAMMLLLTSGMNSLAQSPVTITFLTPPWGVPPNQEALDAFQAETGIQVSVQSVQMQDLYSRVLVAAATGESPADVIFLAEESPSNIVALGHMLALDDLVAGTEAVDLSDFERTEFWTLDGHLFGVPSYSQLVMMDYNAAKHAAAGLDALPTTWAELREQSLQIKAQGIDEYPISLGVIDWSWYLMALSMGDPMFDEALNPIFADEGSKAREAMRMFLGFFSDGLISPQLLANPTTPHQVFWSGVGVFHQAWQGAVAVGNNPDISQQSPNVAYLPLPEVGNTWSYPAAIGISANSQNVDAAWQFIQWYVSPETQTDIYNSVGLFPSRYSVQQALRDAGVIDAETFELFSEQAGRLNELPRYALWWGPFTQIVTETIVQAVQTNMDPDMVVDMLARAWNDLKAEYE